MTQNFEKTKNLKKILNEQKTIDSKFEVVKSYQEMVNEEELIACLENTLEKSQKIGFGENADIFDLIGFDSLCVKAVKKYPKVKIISLEEEADFQQEVFNLGIPTPRYFKKIKNKLTKQEYLIMEKIDGYSLGDLLMNRKKMEHIENFNHENFFNSLKEMVKTMHEGKIYHRDLHSGNIMVTKNGEPVIIDFGAASHDPRTDSDDIYIAVGSKLIDETRGIYQTGSGRLLNDDKQVEILSKSMKNF